jgi:hypothetical protein
MFQTPQRRAGGGIMAGVAPINMQDGGDPNDTWLGVGKGIASSLYDQGSNLVENINMPSPGELGISYDDDGLSLELNEFIDFANEQNTASEDGFVGVFEGKPITSRDAFDFFVVDLDDPVDKAIAAASVGLLAFPPAAAAATLARFGIKGSRALAKLANFQKRFAPSKETGGAVTNFIKRRISPTKESIKGGLGNPLKPGARATQYETNRLLAEEAGDLLIPSAQAEELPMVVEEPAGIAALENERVALDPMIEEAEAEAEGGIANVAKTIAEARSDKFKSPTFRRGDEDLAAVTKEDLIDAGYEGPGALTDYLNDMKFDDELGRYIEEIEAEGKANGGIMRLNGGGKVGLARGAWDFLKNILKKKPKDRTQKEIDAIEDAQGVAFPKAGQRGIDEVQEGVPFRLPGARSTGGRSGGGKTEPGKKTEGKKPKGSEGETVTDTNKPGVFKRNWGKGVVAAAAASPFAYDALSPDDETVPGTATTTAAAAAGDADPVPVPVPVPKPDPDDRDFITKTTDYLKGSLSTLKDQYASDPRKAMFIAGQLMKARKGIVPVNAITALTEANEQYETIKAEREKTIDEGQPDIFKMLDAIVEKQAEFGKPLDEAGQATVLKSLFALSRDSEKMLSLSKMMYQNPQLAGNKDFMEYLINTSTSDASNIPDLIARYNKLKDADSSGTT